MSIKYDFSKLHISGISRWKSFYIWSQRNTASLSSGYSAPAKLIDSLMSQLCLCLNPSEHPTAFWMRNVPQRLMVWTFGLHLMMPFGELMEPFQGGATLKKTYRWGRTLKVYDLALLPSASCVQMKCDLCFLLLPTCPTIPHYDGLFPSGTMSQNRPFLT